MEKLEKMRALVWKEGDVFVSRLNGTNISSYGETSEEAVYNLKEAVELYFEDMPEDEKQEIIESAGSCDEEVKSVEFSLHAPTA
ncbi:MAG: type II toxin-antitoxin system HicB family antitoxin [Candidatus Dadabacteria bacterium]|nr:type II toxin-antitoxin system HicB family antitoxin [Candidatus Dadabacteria bacterium]